MDGEKRRNLIIQRIRESDVPVSGSALAREMKVSRQVIVQDIALLRAENKNVLSTNKGYICHEDNTKVCKKVVAVCHSNEDIRDELYTIVDAGARVRDVIVEHDVYGQISVDLLISSRRDVDEFINKLESSKDKPLKILADNIHYHTMEALDEEALEAAEAELKRRGFLIYN